MDLNEFDYQLLDELLVAFGKGDSLSREQVLDFLSGDEDYTAALINILVKDGYVSAGAGAAGHKLPLVINKQPAAVSFIQNGGYSKRQETVAESKPVASELEQLQKRNLELSNENLEYQLTVRKIEEQIKLLELQQLQRWNMELSDESPKYQQKIRKLEEQIRSLKLKNNRLEYFRYSLWAAGLVIVCLLGWIIKLLLHHH